MILTLLREGEKIMALGRKGPQKNKKDTIYPEIIRFGLNPEVNGCDSEYQENLR